MGSTDDQFCLRWNDFQQFIKSTFQDLRDEKEFMDVTITCDGEHVKAHKVILSACSFTFKSLLKKNSAPHPIIKLWDVSPRDLAAILDFMYCGEANVKQDHLNSFLAVAERLRVRGLCQIENSAGPSGSTKFTNNTEDPNFRVSESSFPEQSAKKPRVGSLSQHQEDDIEEIPHPVAFKQELSDHTPPMVPPCNRRALLSQFFQPVVQQFVPPQQPQEDNQTAQSGHYDESMQGSEYGDYSGYEDIMPCPPVIRVQEGGLPGGQPSEQASGGDSQGIGAVPCMSSSRIPQYSLASSSPASSQSLSPGQSPGPHGAGYPQHQFSQPPVHQSTPQRCCQQRQPPAHSHASPSPSNLRRHKRIHTSEKNRGM